MKMWHLARILSIVVVWWAAGIAMGNTSPVPLPEVPVPPFVKVTVPEGPLQLGDVWFGGAFQAGAQVKVHILANCPYQVEASFRDLRHRGSSVPLSPNQVIVAINGKQTSLGGKVPVALSGVPTPASGTNVPVQLQVGVTNMMNCRAGRYDGTLVITVMAVP
ncbi:MAG: hypothetical protein JW955_18060 [Sedimentisphaerales bacterium]|nr:hypothetical protein [Sedimentisphaerales bacterium]